MNKVLNNVDYSKLIPKEHQLKPGQTAEFRLVGLKKNPNKPGHWIIPNIKGVPVEDRITTSEGTRWIAPVKDYDGNDKPVYHEIMFTRAEFGRIYLHGDSADDVDKFNYLYCSNFNEANPKRDKKRTAIYTYVDKKAAARKEMKSMDDKIKAMETLSKMKDKEVEEIATSRGWVEDEFELMKVKVYQFAMDSPSEFLAVSKSPSRETESIVNRALRRNIIQYVAKDKKFQYVGSKEAITIVPRKGKKDAIDYLVNYLMNDEKGRVVLDHIKKLLESDKLEIE